MSGWTTDRMIEALDDVLRNTVSLGRDLAPSDADRETACPGWTVRDQFAHMAGLEQVLSGAPQPDIELPPLDHVRNEFDEYMERQVHVRRQLPLSAIVDEIAGLRPRRIAQLRSAAAEGDPPVAGPFGDRLLSQSLPIRVFDLWTHEQDIRRAVGLPVRQGCDAASISIDRVLSGWTHGLASGLAEALGDVHADITVRVTAPEPSETSIRIGQGTGQGTGQGGAGATIEGDVAVLTALFCGRAVPTDELSGDPALVDALRDRLAFTP